MYAMKELVNHAQNYYRPGSESYQRRYFEKHTTNMNLMETRNNLKAQCEAEQIKVNRRPDNVKIIEVHKSLEQGKGREPIEQS